EEGSAGCARQNLGFGGSVPSGGALWMDCGPADRSPCADGRQHGTLQVAPAIVRGGSSARSAAQCPPDNRDGRPRRLFVLAIRPLFFHAGRYGSKFHWEGLQGPSAAGPACGEGTDRTIGAILDAADPAAAMRGYGPGKPWYRIGAARAKPARCRNHL